MMLENNKDGTGLHTYNKDGKQRISTASEIDVVANNRNSWQSFKFSLEKENFE